MSETLYFVCDFLGMVSYKKNLKIIFISYGEKKRESNLKYLKVWGCLVKVNIPINKKRKVEKKFHIHTFITIINLKIIRKNNLIKFVCHYFRACFKPYKDLTIYFSRKNIFKESDISRFHNSTIRNF